MYKDKEKQKQSQRERTRRYRDKTKGVTSEGVTDGCVTPKVLAQINQACGDYPNSIIDACGTAHPIDYEGRRKSYNLLRSWAEGKGTQAQQVLGQLAMTYNVLKGIDINHYLGVA
jgi:hypothetical protein